MLVNSSLVESLVLNMPLVLSSVPNSNNNNNNNNSSDDNLVVNSNVDMYMSSDNNVSDNNVSDGSDAESAHVHYAHGPAAADGGQHTQAHLTSSPRNHNNNNITNACENNVDADPTSPRGSTLGDANTRSSASSASAAASLLPRGRLDGSSSSRAACSSGVVDADADADADADVGAGADAGTDVIGGDTTLYTQQSTSPRTTHPHAHAFLPLPTDAHANALHADSVISAKSASQAKEDLSDEDRLRMQLEGEKSLLARKAMAILLSKYVFFVMTIGLYFGLSIWQTMTNLSSVENAALLTAVATSRSPTLQFSLFQARQHLFFSWAVSSANPVDATTRAGNYRESSIAELNESMKSTRAVVFGDTDYGLSMPETDLYQDAILYGDLCSIKKDTFKNFVPGVPDYVIDDCRSIENGLFEHGLYGALEFAFEKINSFLPQVNELAVYNLVFGLPPPPGQTVASSSVLLDDLQRVSLVINEYLFYFLELSAAVYNATALEIYSSFRNILIIFLIVFSLFLAACYVAMFHPTSLELLRVSNSTKAMLMLLPPDVIKHVAPAQKYIDENYSSQ
jgi:hypothetical protein